MAVISKTGNLTRLALAVLLVPATLAAQPVITEISGIDGEMRANVEASLSLKQAEDLEQVSVWRLRQMASDAREEVRQALEPFGFYSANVSVRLEEPAGEAAPWRARVQIAPGEPVIVNAVAISISEPASTVEAFNAWRAGWPLPEGSVLRHRPYEQSLSELEQIAESHGFFDARFARRVIRVDPERNEAGIEVDYAAGNRYVIGEIDYGDTGFNEDLMRAQTIVEPGSPYLSSELDRQREVLVRTGYFEQVVVQQQRNPDSSTVDLTYDLKKRPPNTYRVLAGFGTDTGARLQLGWTRHYLSDRGDRLDTRFGAQQTDSEFVLRSNYQHPYGNQPGNFLTGEVLLKRERDRFRFEDIDRIEPVFDPFGGNRNQAQLTVGRLRERPVLDRPFEPLRERLFVTYLNEQFDAFSQSSLSDEQIALLRANPGLLPFLDTDTNTVALGAEWTLFQLVGEGFAAEGMYAQARVLGSAAPLGSDTSFLQGYLNARWHWRFLPRHKLLVRGEVGYTAADTTTLNLSIPGDPRQLRLDITELPELFRFKAGGDRSVRGYGYEALSTNRNGANHTLVGSMEYEWNFAGDFAAAAFYDIGNAFNDFAEPNLKRGAGLGLRWYTLIGPVQLDLARALDDDSFRIHFTIGTKLL
ncbi:MAG TPA: BamA/TamA family outer membrane protein [Wenzhouxiangellaceae bacterium]|nr:BamA/TamA family outer membrane protein [Wenzhouxiangellaceae bacterium]